MTLARQPSEAGVDWLLTLPGGDLVEAWEPGTSGLVPAAGGHEPDRTRHGGQGPRPGSAGPGAAARAGR